MQHLMLISNNDVNPPKLDEKKNFKCVFSVKLKLNLFLLHIYH